MLPWKLLNILKILPVTLLGCFEAEILTMKMLTGTRHGPEISFRKPYIYSYFSCIPMRRGHWRKSSNDKERSSCITKILKQHPDQFLELVRVFIEASKIFIFLLLKPGILKLKLSSSDPVPLMYKAVDFQTWISSAVKF